MTPSVGSVWGVPDRTDSWRRVRSVGEGEGYYIGFDTWGYVSTRPHEDWSAWLASSGAVEITKLLKEKR
jgi:hypothetical protein